MENNKAKFSTSVLGGIINKTVNSSQGMYETAKNNTNFIRNKPQNKSIV